MHSGMDWTISQFVFQAAYGQSGLPESAYPLNGTDWTLHTSPSSWLHVRSSEVMV